MAKRDDKLEEKLNALDSGESVEHVLQDGSGSSELGYLIRLAKSIRELPHPEISPHTLEAEKKRLITAARDKKLAKQRNQGKRTTGFTGQWLFVPAFAGLALLLLMVFALAAGAGIYYAGPLDARYATLSEVTGQIEVADSAEAPEWYTVSDGDRVSAGQRLRTGLDSQVTLTFFEGTTTTLAPNTDLLLNEIGGDWGDVLHVSLIQNEGQTDHQVVPFENVEAAYDVFTPTGSASVRGTEFSVIVGETGRSLFAVDTGQVLVSNEGSQELVLAGQGLISELGKPLAAPKYTFVLQGWLEKKEGKKWTVDGASFLIRGSTIIDGSPEVDDFVLVQGRIMKNNWVADSILSPVGSYHGGYFSGMVEEQSGDTWMVNGREVLVEENPDEIGVGDLVRVSYIVLEDGTWKAEEIVPLASEGEEPDSDPDEGEEDDDGDEDVFEGLRFSTDEFEYSACESVPNITSTLSYGEGGEDPGTINVILKYEPSELPEPLAGILIEPDEFQMEPGDSVEVIVTILLEEGMTGLPEDGEVLIRVFTTSEIEEVSLNIELKCDLEPDEEDEEAKEDATCTGNDLHPKGLKLEDEFAELYLAGKLTDWVTYVDIMTWFCEEHYGFGEIDQMVNLAARYGVDVDYVFGLREGGKGWGQIKQQLAAEAEGSEELMNPAGKVPPGKNKSEEKKNKNKPKNKGDD